MESEQIDRNFLSMLKKLWAQNRVVCIGLDSDYEKIPEFVKNYTMEEMAKTVSVPAHQIAIEETMFLFNKSIVDATADLVCAYKPNIAFYEEQGVAGISALIRTIAYIKKRAPEVPIILDAKRADIGNTNRGYVQSAFEMYGADAITVHPYLGAEAMKPFLEQKNQGIIVLWRTSHPGAGEVQDLEVDGKPFYQVVAKRVAENWNENGNCAVVVGATYPEELQEVRKIVGNMPILVPGVGTQGADVRKTVLAGGNEIIINTSRGAIFASNGSDFAEATRKETIRLSELINRYRTTK